MLTFGLLTGMVVAGMVVTGLVIVGIVVGDMLVARARGVGTPVELDLRARDDVRIAGVAPSEEPWDLDVRDGVAV